MPDRTTRLRLGAFVAGGLLLLATLVVLFGGSPRVFSSRSKYVVTFPEAPGVGVGTPVRKSGVRVGEVTALDLDDDTGEVKVSIDLDRKFRPRATEDATISRGLLSGDTSLDFVPKAEPGGLKVPPGDVYPPGTVIPGVPPINPGTLLKGATDALPNAQENVARVVASIQRFEQAVPKVEAAVVEIAALARGGREFVPELRTTNTRVQDLIGTAAQPGDPVTVRDALRQVVELLQAIRPAADDLRALLKDSGPELTKTLQSIRRTSDNANEVLNPDNRKAVAATLKNTQTATDDLVRTIRLAGLLVDQSEKTVRELNARLAQAEVVVTGAGRVVANAERASKPVADAAPGIVQGVDQAVRSLNQAAEQANKALTDVRGLVGGAAGGGGTVQKALTDPALYNNLNDTVIGVNRVVARLEKVARDLEVFSDKVARRPESLGVSGVVRPNTGLKDPPGTPLPQQPAPLPGMPTAVPVTPAGGLAPIPPVPFGPVVVEKGAGELPPRR